MENFLYMFNALGNMIYCSRTRRLLFLITGNKDKDKDKDELGLKKAHVQGFWSLDRRFILLI
jgi:hypothetical protein